MISLENFSKLGVKENNNIYVILMNSLGSIIRLFFILPWIEGCHWYVCVQDVDIE